jgi:3-oxoacyl-[acyl-carrier-protein] synthase II
MFERVVLTGLGLFCSLGNDYRSFWSALALGRSGVTRPGRLAEAAIGIGAEVAHLESPVLGPRERRLDRAAQLALAASAAALDDAGLGGERPESESHRAGVVLGSSRGAAERLEHWHGRFAAEGPEGVGPHASPHTTAGNLSGAVARRFGLRGPALSVSAACASASQAIGFAFDLIRAGRADLMVAGGTEACLTPFSVAMFAKAGILSRYAGDPAAASRPFDRDRDGIVLGEGAGMVVLESAAHARRRGARVHAELLGFGTTCDALSLTAVPEDGSGLARAIEMALADARLSADRVSYVNAHGTATVTGDRAETAALKTALGDHARRVPISSTKSMTGHLIGAAGGLEAIACVGAIAEGLVPPTINLDHPDPRCDLDYVPREARRARVEIALSISMGFGGTNACLVLGGPI